MRRHIVNSIGIFILLFACGALWAAPTTDGEAEMAVTGWLRLDPQPLGPDTTEGVI